MSSTSAAEILSFGEHLLPSEDDGVEELQKKDQVLFSIERDIKQVADELAARKSVEDIRYCVDFDVLYSASHWRGAASGENFWASLIFFLEGIKPLTLPGALFEALRFLHSSAILSGRPKAKQENLIGSLGQAFLKAVEQGHVRDDSIVRKSVEAYSEFREYKPSVDQVYFLYDAVKYKSEMYTREMFGDFDFELFEKCITYLCEFAPNRSRKILNNRIDALNYTLCTQLNRVDERNSGAPNYILVSDSTSMSGIHRSLSDRLSRHGRRTSSVWNSRVASMFSLISSATNSIIEARNTAWELYQSLIYERRAIHYEIARRESGKGTPWRRENSHRDPLLELVQSFESLQRGIIAADVRSSEMVSFLDGAGLIDFERFSDVMSSVILEKLEKEDKNFYKKIMTNEKNDVFNISVFEKDSKFSYTRKFNISSETQKSVDALLIYDNKDQLIIHSSISVQEFLDVVNSVRMHVFTGLSAGRYHSVDDDRETARIFFSSESKDYDTGRMELNWKKLIYGTDQLSPAGVLSASRKQTEGEIIAPTDQYFAVSAASSIKQEDVNFFRFKNAYIDVSMEYGHVVFTTVPGLRDQMVYVHERLSNFDSERVFSRLNREHKFVVSKQFY